MPEVLGRVVTDLGSPRGPDALHRVRVESAWVERGVTIEVELPRNLTCAACDGGGCDTCERSGAITVRGRQDPVDLVEVALPAGQMDVPFVIRIPEHGGLPPAGSDLPRGHLLLRVEPSTESDPTVALAVRSARVVKASVPPPAPLTQRKRWPPWLAAAIVVGLALLVWALTHPR